MSQDKKKIRATFRDAVFARDHYQCAMCGCQPHKDQVFKELDSHHILDRHLLPNGGYVKENGISLCHDCHVKAEVFHSTGTAFPGFDPEDLFKKIGSSPEKALAASKRLK